MQPKFTQRNLWYFCSKLVTLVLFLSVFSQLSLAQDTRGNSAPSVGLAPNQPSGPVKIDPISPDAGNPVSRAWCYNTFSVGNYRLNFQSVLNTTLTPIGAAFPFVFPGAGAWVSTTNKLYVIDQGAPFTLYTIDTLTGARTFVANCTGVPQANFTGMTWDPTTNTMYGASTSLAASQIFTVNITTGVCTPIGSASTTAPGVIMLNAAPGGSLFSVDLVTDNLYRWNKTTGVATLIGPMGLDVNFGQDGHFDMSDGQYYWTAIGNGLPSSLRIIDTLSGTSVLVGTYAGGIQTETFSIYTPPQPPCTGTPNPGATQSTTAAACPTDLFTLSLQNYTPGSGLTYQWQTASSGSGPWTNAGPNSASWTKTQTVPTWYRCIVTCTTNSGISTPVFVDQNLFYNCYCINPAASNADEDIFNVTIGTLNNSSDCSTTAPGAGSIRNRYSNYRGFVSGGVVTGNMAISIQIGTCGGNFPNGAVAWIDFNHNGAFDHPAERVFYENSTSTGPHTATGFATIPGSALTGLTGMRVIAVENIGGPLPVAQTPCGPYTWGETEDYLVDIQPCVPLPVTGPTAPASVTGECSGIIAIPVNTYGASYPVFMWEYRVNPSSPWIIANNGDLGGVVTGATTGTLVLINVPSSLNGYQFRAIVSNPCSALDFTNPPTTIIVGPLVARVTPTSATICVGSVQMLSLDSPQATFCSGTLNTSVPDFTANGINHTIPVSGIPGSATITEIRVVFNMTHTWDGDMVIVLKSPTGAIINLDYYLTATGGAGVTTGFTNTTISSLGGPQLMTGSNPYTGVFQADRINTGPFFIPQGGPNGFLPTTTSWAAMGTSGSAVNGNWTIAMYDGGPADLGVLQNWCITLSYGSPVTGIWSQNPAPPVPNQFARMWLNAGTSIPYTGGPASAIWVNPLVNTVYTVIASTTSPACTSAPVQIPVNVTQPLVSASNPVNATVCAGGTISFSTTALSAVGAPYNGPFTYVWEESQNNGLTWSVVTNGGIYSGATTNTLTLTGVTRAAPLDMNLFRYRVRVSAPPCPGFIQTASALLTVNPLPVVTITATDLALTPGQYSTITATSVPAPNAVSPNWVWTRNGVVIAGANTGSIIADIDHLGVYRVSVTDVNGCRNSSNSILIESEVSDRLWLYPNPTTGKFQVRLYYSQVFTEIRRVIIYNAQGQKIMEKEFPLSNITPHYAQLDFDLSGHAGGVYVVKVYDRVNKTHIQGLLIKQ